MTMTDPRPTSGWPTPLVDADTNGIHDLLYKNTEYVRRIHWWVRLFGLVWIVIPVVATVMAVFLMLGVLTASAPDRPSSNYTNCITNWGYSAAECARMYPGK